MIEMGDGMKKDKTYLRDVICGNCDGIIKDVCVETMHEESNQSRVIIAKQYYFDPEICPHCGARITGIVKYDSFIIKTLNERLIEI